MANYIVSSGEVSSGIILSNKDSMTVFDGGMASDTTVKDYGTWMYVSSNGTANNTTVSLQGFLTVFSGGVASDTSLNSLGFLHVSSGGTTDNTTINSGGGMQVSFGGIAISTSVLGGYLINSGLAINTNVSSGGNMRIYDNGIANYTLINSSGRVLNYAIMNSTTVYPQGSMWIYSGGTAYNTIVSGFWGRLFVSSGGVICSTTAISDSNRESSTDRAWIEIFNGGVANNTIVDSYSLLYVRKGGSSYDTTVNPGANVYLLDGGIANSIMVNPGGGFTVSDGGTATNILENGGCVYIADRAYATFVSNTFSDLILSNTTATTIATVHSGTTANNIAVNLGGKLIVYSGGTATNVIWTPFSGIVQREKGAEVTFATHHLRGVFYGRGVVLVSSAMMLENTSVQSGQEIYVMPDGLTNNTAVSSDGSMYVFSGGATSNTTVNSGGYLLVSSGGYATHIEAKSWARLDFAVASDTYIEGKCGDSIFEIKDGVANDYMVNPENIIRVYSGGTANITTINSRGELHVSSGGIANNTVVNSCGLLFVPNGGIAESTTVSSGGNFYANGGSVNDTIVYSGGNLLILSGGTAQQTMIESGVLRVSNGGYASSVILRAGADRNQGDIYVSAGGVVEDVQVEQYGDCYVSFRGVANNVTVNDGGCIYISSSGTATIAFNPWQGSIFSSAGAVVTYLERDAAIYYGNREQGIISKTDSVENPNIESGLSAIVYSGGTATNLIASNGASVSFVVAPDTYVQGAYNDSAFEMKDGYISGYTVNSGCSLVVSSGGVADATAVNSRGGMLISSGGTTANTAISGGGNLIVYNGGTADNTTVSSGGSIHLSSGGVAENAILSSGGRGYIYDGGTANNAVVSSGGSLFVSSGATAQQTEVASGGAFVIYSGGTANSTTVNTWGNMYVSNGGIAESTTVSSGGNLWISNGGTANQTMIESGVLRVSNGGYASSVILRAGADRNQGDIYVSAGGVVEDVQVEQYGDCYVSSGGSLNNATINAGGYLRVENSGTATAIKENGGYVDVQNGAKVAFVANTFSGVELVNASATVHSGTTAVKTAVGSNSYLYVYEGGSATETVVDSGYFYVLSDGTATKTTVDSNGQLQISSGGVATSTTVNSGGRFYVLSGATVTEATAASGAYLDFSVTPDTLITGTSGGSAFTIKEGVVNDGYTLETARLELGVGVKAANTTVNSGGQLYVSTGAAANGIIENGGSVEVEEEAEVSFAQNTFSGLVLSNASATVHSGTTAVSTIASSGGRIRVYSGGIADGVDINGGGFLYISSGGTATTIKENGGYVSAAEGANVTFESANLEKLILLDSTSIHSNTRMTSTTVSRGGIAVSSGGIADTTILLSGKTRIFSGGVANSTTIYSYAGLEISSGGVASGVDIKSRGSANVVSGGTLRDLNISSGGTLNLDRGKITGKVMIENGAYVRTYGSGTLDFDISGITPDAEVRVNNLSMISGSLQYTLTVGIQRSGTYELARGALRFNSAITVLNTDGVQLGILTTTNPLTTAKATYTLVSFGESLSVEVKAFTPAAPTASADVTDSTTQAVTVTAVFGEDCTVREYSYDGKDWLAYTEPIVFTENGTVYFRGADAAGIVSEVTSYEVTNIEAAAPDTVAPSNPAGLRAFVEGQDVALVWNVSSDDSSGVKEYVITYALDGQEFMVRTSGTSYVLSNATAGTWSWSVQAVDFAGNESAVIAGNAFIISDFKPYTVEYSADNFEHVIRFTITSPTLDAFRMPTGTYQLRVRQEGSNEWLTGDSIVAAETNDVPQLVKSDADGNADVFFANAVGTWEAGYLAQHVGSINDWTGTNEYAVAYGKNKLADIIEGSTDANILLMTDDENGDALFVDDIYSDSPDELGLSQSRIAQIHEIRAGAGADVVDMTSQCFEYIGDGLTIRGGEGNDTIWANKGNNKLFGDAGNDRIVGASGNDVIVGGIGNDRMHGGGGNDVFTFCDNWGADNVEQLATGSVTLWFASGSMENWNDGTLTYTDGENSVTVSGVTADKVTLKFGDDGSAQFATLSGMGAFFDATSERIFEESGKGILVSL